MAIELDAHEHGTASLDIAIDGNAIEMKFKSPAVNIVGFEYTTANEQQQLLITRAKNNLSNFDAMFQLVGDLYCQTVNASAHWVTKHEEGHEEADEAIVGGHAEFIADYKLECNQAQNLAGIEVKLMEFFPAIADLDVQIIYSGGQSKQELDVNNTLIKLAN